MYDIFPTYSYYKPYEHISFYVLSDKDTDLDITITYLCKTITSTSNRIKKGRNKLTIDIGLPVGSYMVRANFMNAEIIYTAISVRDEECPSSLRYGFLSEFNTEDFSHDKIDFFSRFHIDTVQFYDWSYRHDDLVPPTETYSDMMGKHNNLTVVRDYIDNLHIRRMKAIGYGAIYASSENYWKSHKSEGYYTFSGQPMTFINRFFLMNISRTCPWHEHIIQEYRKACNEVGFDGIHMDTYGFPKKALDYEGELHELEYEIPELINDAYTTIGNSTALIFNNVGGWPGYTDNNINDYAKYVEIWPPMIKYQHLVDIAEHLKASRKPVIIAAYPAPFRLDTAGRALEAELILSFVIASAGATQLCFGEDNSILTQGYYSDNSKLTNHQLNILRHYHDFFLAYSDLLYSKSNKDVSMTHQDWDNHEYMFTPKGSAFGESNKIWYRIIESGKRKIIFTINLTNNNSNWNEGKDTPPSIHIALECEIHSKIIRCWTVSPDKETLEPTLIEPEFLEKENSLYAKCNIDLFRTAMTVIEEE